MELFLCCLTAWNLNNNSCNLTAKLLNEEFPAQLTFRSDLPANNSKVQACDISVKGYSGQTENCDWARVMLGSRGGQCLETRPASKAEAPTRTYSIHGGICIRPTILTNAPQPSPKTINLLAKSILNLLGLQPASSNLGDEEKLHTTGWGMGTDLCQIRIINVDLQVILQTPEFYELHSCLDYKQMSGLPIQTYQTISIINVTLLIFLTIVFIFIYKKCQ